MSRGLVGLGVALMLITTTARADDKKPENPKKFEGSWVGTSWKRGQGEVPKDMVNTELILTADKYEFPKGINRISKSGTIKVDEAKGTIDFTPDDGPAKGRTLLGLYKVDGDVLTLCFAGSGGERPKELKSMDRNTVLATYSRKKK